VPPPYGPHVRAWILKRHPRLTEAGYSETSDDSPRYNCIGWAAEDQANVWWPNGGGHWPCSQGEPRDESVGAFAALFAGQNYQPCGLDDALEPGFEKVAIYEGTDRRVKHMARQLRSGRWTSKLGDGWDIEHVALSGLEDDRYGQVRLILKRPIP